MLILEFTEAAQNVLRLGYELYSTGTRQGSAPALADRTGIPVNRVRAVCQVRRPEGGYHLIPSSIRYTDWNALIEELYGQRH